MAPVPLDLVALKRLWIKGWFARALWRSPIQNSSVDGYCPQENDQGRGEGTRQGCGLASCYLAVLLPGVAPGPVVSLVKPDSHGHHLVATIIEYGPARESRTAWETPTRRAWAAAAAALLIRETNTLMASDFRSSYQSETGCLLIVSTARFSINIF